MAGGKEVCFYGSRRQHAGRFHEDGVVKVNFVAGAWWSHTSHRRSGIFWFTGGLCSTPLKLGIRLSCPFEVSRSTFYLLGNVFGMGCSHYGAKGQCCFSGLCFDSFSCKIIFQL